MKLRHLLLLLALPGAGLLAKESKRIPAPEGVLPVVVIESLSDPGNAFTDFDRLDLALRHVSQQRQWPLKVACDRLAGGTPDYQTELRITLQPIRLEVPNEWTLRAWVTLYRDGRERDFGIVAVRYNPRLGENPEDALEKLFRLGATEIARKVEPVLFPDLKVGK